MRRLRFAPLFLAVFSTSALAQTDQGPTSGLPKHVRLSHYGELPLSFEANSGQTDGRVKFVSRGSGFSLFLTEDEAVVVLKKAGNGKADATTQAASPTRKSNPNESLIGDTIRMQLLGANATARVGGSGELPGKANYFIGNDPSKWRTNVLTYSKVEYEGVYPGVDLVYYGNQGQLEYDFVVAPGTDPGSIGLRFDSRNELRIDRNGDLLLQAEGVRFQKPRLFQDSDGTRKDVDGQYDLTADNTIRFAVGDYDHSKPLVIDPVLVYSTYLGGSGVDSGSGIAVDASGNAYVIGTTTSLDFPTANAIQSVFPSTQTPETGPSSVFITKINASGSALVYSTYLGGSGPDSGFGIAVDPAGNVYATGRAGSDNFPTVNPIQPERTACCGTSGLGSGFVAKLNSAGSALIYSTYLGGFGEDWGTAIAADAAGNAYVTGITSSPFLPDCTDVACDFPTTPNALQRHLGGDTGANGDTGTNNAFVTKINPNGSALVFSTYLGGSQTDAGSSIAVDAAGNIYVAGSASSGNFPTANAIQPTRKAGQNAFVTKISASGTAFVYSTYLGGSTNDGAGGITADSSGNAYVAGGTSSADFPTVNPLQSTLSGSGNAFLTKINPIGSALVYSTFFGGSGGDGAGGVAVDHLGNAYIAGSTTSTNFPVLNAPQPTFGGGTSDGFVAEINASGDALVYSTFLGGSGDDGGGPIALDPSGNVYVTGNTDSTNFPTARPLQPAFGGGAMFGGDAFVAKIASTIAAPLNVVIDGCDSGVTNAVLPSGRAISDLIAECAKDASNHGEFVSCVAHVTNDLRETRTISGQQKGAIQSCAAQAHLP